MESFPISLAFETEQGAAITRAFCSSASGKLYTLAFNANPFSIAISKSSQVADIPVANVATLPVVSGPLNGIILTMPFNNKLIIANPMLENQRIQREFNTVNFEKSLGRIVVTPDGLFIIYNNKYNSHR